MTKKQAENKLQKLLKKYEKRTGSAVTTSYVINGHFAISRECLSKELNAILDVSFRVDDSREDSLKSMFNAFNLDTYVFYDPMIIKRADVDNSKSPCVIKDNLQDDFGLDLGYFDLLNVLCDYANIYMERGNSYKPVLYRHENKTLGILMFKRDKINIDKNP